MPLILLKFILKPADPVVRHTGVWMALYFMNGLAARKAEKVQK